MSQTLDDINSFSFLYLQISELHIDSVQLQSNTEAQYIRAQMSNTIMAIQFSQKDNTIKNNYAGGEWDTWQRID